jgi:hypothetical protein
MTRLLTDGAESGDATRVSASGTGTIQVISSQKRTGTYSYRTSNETGVGNSFYFYTLVSSPTEWYLRFAWRAEQATTGYMLRFMTAGGGESGSLRVAAYGVAANFTVYDGTTLRATSSNVAMNHLEWHVYEVHYKHAASPNGVIQLKFDGNQIINFSGAVNAQASIGRIDLYTTGTQNSYSDYDDFALNDTAGGVDNTWCGDGGVLAALVPNGAGNYTQLVASAGNAYQCVDEVPSNGDTDYVSSSTLDEKSTYTMSNVAGVPAGASIPRVWVELSARKTVAVADNIATFLRSGSTDAQGSDQALSTSYARYKSAEYLTDPADSAAWTTTKVDALEAGAIVR